MTKKKKGKKGEEKKEDESEEGLGTESHQLIFAVFSFAFGLIFALAAFGKAGLVGDKIYSGFDFAFGRGFFILPLVFFIMGFSFLLAFNRSGRKLTILGGALLFLVSLGLADLLFGLRTGGYTGYFIAYPLLRFLDFWASLVILLALFVISFVLILRLTPVSLKQLFKKEKEKIFEEGEVKETKLIKEQKYEEEKTQRAQKGEIEAEETIFSKIFSSKKISAKADSVFNLPPLDLFSDDRGKPTSGDIKANSNIIKRTLYNFGIEVEMGEVSVGPSVTRYTLRPAQGIKLSRLTALHNDLALALAVHPLRIEAPIPGKSLVGIEIPNRQSAVVGLKGLLSDEEFQKSERPLIWPLGRDVTGRPVYADLARMPHLLIAGSTGSGKTCAADTYVFSEKGLLTFRELCPLPLNSEKEFKIKIITRDGIEETSKNYNNGICDFYKIKTEEGYTIEVTAEHPLWVLDENHGMTWKAGENIKIGDYVAIARKAELFGSKKILDFKPSKNKTNKANPIKIPEAMTPELGLLLGLLTADGGVTIKNRIVYTQANEHLLELYKNLLNKLFLISSPIIKKSGESNKAKDIVVHSKWLYEFLIYLGMKPVKSPQKEIPLYVRMADSETLKAFLRGLMRNDAHLSQNSLELCVASRNLVKQIQLILLNFGIISSIRPKKVKTYPERTYWRLSVYGKELLNYSETIDFLTEEEREKIKPLLSLARNPNKDVVPNIAATLRNLTFIYRRKFAKLTNKGWHYQNNILIPKYAFAHLKDYNNGNRNPSYEMLNTILNFYNPIAGTQEYQQLEEIKGRNFYWAKVESINRTKGEGYDFEVPGSNSFVGNGFVNHNSIAIHTLILSLLYKNTPSKLKFIIIDPKRVELTYYSNLPHLLAPVIIEPKKAILALKWAISEMERRYDFLSRAGVRDIASYQRSTHFKENPMPYLVIVIDELADLMAGYPREMESSIVRLSQMARAVGLHLVVSTQRPSIDVITGLIKANITNRIALQVASQIDSRTILDSAGAEKLLGRGDMLFLSNETGKPRRIQGAYVGEAEIKRVVQYLEDEYEGEEEAGEVGPVEFQKNAESERIEFREQDFDNLEADDELYPEAESLVFQSGKASASYLQRRLSIGYARAARLLDLMEQRGIIGPTKGAKPREILMPRSEGKPEDRGENNSQSFFDKQK